MKRALITGISGQDGAWLALHLLRHGYEVHGSFRRGAERTFSRLHRLGIADDIQYVLLELCEATNLVRAVDRTAPDEVYHLAAQSFVGDSFEQPAYTLDVNATGTARLLDAVRTVRPDARWYQASTSEMFGAAGAGDTLLDEHAPMVPRSPYAIAKLAAHHMVGLHREAYGTFAARGILFNHESALRGPEFVTRKVTRAVAAIALGHQQVLTLGNLEARRDWGHAPEYVDAMHRMLQAERGDDFVVATGRAESVRTFVELAFAAIDVSLAWRGTGSDTVGVEVGTDTVRVRIDPSLYRPAEVGWLRGDASKAARLLGWRPQVGLEELVHRMVRADLDELAGDLGR
ncbi:MAG: GDP-mannose 4,6-dehydratase [Alphaproteobacteria bacterium]|nr:GDP-mannose 4,6-dehydratase [Alphaproteobacteria bacterium]